MPDTRVPRRFLLGLPRLPRIARGCAAALGGLLITTLLAFARDPLLLAVRPVEARLALTHLLEDMAQARSHAARMESETPLVVAATAAYEDSALLRRPGWVPPVSITGGLRALARNLRGHREGASTIPMGLAKAAYRESSRGTMAEKFDEVLIASALAREVTPAEFAHLYLAYSAANYVPRASLEQRVRYDPQAIERLALALFGRSVWTLSTEEQILFAGTPRGLSKLRREPVVSLERARRAARRLVESGHLSDADERRLTLESAPASAFSFVSNWRALLASDAVDADDLDFVNAISDLRTRIAADLASRFPTVRLRTAVGVVGGGGEVLARSGGEAATLALNYGSIAKIEALDYAIDVLGLDTLRALPLVPAVCVRWFWHKVGRNAVDTGRGTWCPSDVAPPRRPMQPDEAVARSINTTTATFVAVLPLLIWLHSPGAFAQLARALEPGEVEAWVTDADKAITSQLLGSLGVRLPAERVPDELAYTTLQRALFRTLNRRRTDAGLPAESLPEDPTQTLGNDSSATVEQIGHYIHRRFLRPDSCVLTPTGAALADHRKQGTLSAFARERPELVFAGKTGSSSSNTDVIAAVATCIDHRPVVIVVGARPLTGELPHGLRGAFLVPAIGAMARSLETLGRPLESLAESNLMADPLVELTAPSAEEGGPIDDRQAP